MKNLISTILLLFMTLPILAQERSLEQVETNLYKYKVYGDNGTLQQSGWYTKVNDEFIAIGIWKDSFGTIALFQNGELQWIRPRGEKKYTKEEIELHRLRMKVARLEEALTSL